MIQVDILYSTTVLIFRRSTTGETPALFRTLQRCAGRGANMVGALRDGMA